MNLQPVKAIRPEDMQKASQVISAGLQAVDPAASVRRHLEREGHTLIAGGMRLDLDAYDRVFLIGLGKAAVAMATPVVDLLGDRLVKALVVTKHAKVTTLPGMPASRVILGAHPVPAQASIDAAKAIGAMVEPLTERDLVLCVISGGGSSLVSWPVEGVSLDDMRQLTQLLLASGAAIHEINTLRKQLDRLKGGGLARMTAPAGLVTFILSDVIGNPLETIASGPTVPDSSTPAEALAILGKYGLQQKAPEPIFWHLQQAAAANNLPDKGAYPACHVNILVASNEVATASACKQAEALGFTCHCLGNSVAGEARDAGRRLAGRLVAEVANRSRPFCLIAGGETTVTLTGKGRGGRNQEVAAGAVDVLSGYRNIALIALGTDGEDGPTDAAGAVVTGETKALAEASALDVHSYLAVNDVYTYFKALDQLVITAPTGTNVNDITFMFAF